MDFPDYYAILSLPHNPPPSTDDIRNAYKKASLLTHPDRSPGLSETQRRAATERFQKVADAYYVLSDPIRRKEYDQTFKETNWNQNDYNTSNSESFFSRFFGSNSSTEGNNNNQRPDPDLTFATVFEDMLRPEVESKLPLWKYAGTLSGATLGFILGSLPGAALGSVAGNRLGAVRDAKGKSVAAVFVELDGGQKAAILKGLAMKVLGHALS
ncbi:hypothetical protein CROQUDRAFT_67261 [Cronartium quercuum f. sp. fusiforme G11]|uniref:J domain-containing protein n=1 Tax=Cronartium quercuum f. sp. fusiforme G11 TaxID=708437 RepID=A0A9P6T9D6_9BASI|nr:hypothetical protein CROQUDRAFT_67261 [Cronartium quercuum f. sp. fusiforme G11]